jgi:histidyl-tRNA synthetase
MELLKQNSLEKFVRLDFSLARGLEYYTGTVFEVKVEEGPSVGGGGRYDKLVELYGGSPTPAVGISFGVDRLLDAIESKKTVPPKALVLVCAFSSNQTESALQACQLLRKTGINAELDLLQRNVSKNSEYAKKKGIRFLAIIGENEEKNGTVLIKDFRENRQFELKNSAAGLAELQKMIG